MAFTRTAVSISGTLTNGSANVTSVSSTAQLFVNMLVYGVGIQADTFISAISGTTVTMSRNATASGSTAITGQYITQSGTDADPSGLSAMTGVTTITQASGDQRRTVFDLGTNQLVVTGTLTHDPDIFEIVTNLQNGINLNAGAVYNYGVKRTINGQDSYSRGLGLVFTYTGAIASNFGLYAGAGTFNWNGGMIKSACPPLINATFTTNSFNCVWHNTNPGTDYQLRFGTAAPTFNAITLSGVQRAVLLFLNSGFNAATVKYEFGAYQTPGGGGADRVLLNSVFTGNQSTADIRLNQLSGTKTQITAVKNPDRFPVVNRLNNGARGDIPVVEAVTLNVTDSTNAAAANVVGYIKDTNNGARINSSGTPSNNYTSDRVYVASSNASGVLSMGDILTLAINEDPASVSAINYDYRSNFGNNSADFNVYLGGYEFNPTLTRQTLMGNGGKSVAWTMFSDSNVTASRTAALAYLGTKFAIDPVAKTVTVLANATYDEMYDATKAYKYQGTQTAVETPTISNLILSASGSNLTAYTGWSLIVNTGVTLAAGTKFGFASFTTVTLNGSGKITAVYGSTAGVSTSLELRSVKPGASYIVANNATKTTIQFGVNNEVTAQDYTVYFPPGSSGTQVYVARQGYGDQFDYEVITLVEGAMWYQFTDIVDEGITQTTKATVAAYTDLETTNKLYDYIAYYRTTEPGIKLGDIVVRAGTQLQFGSYSGVVNQSATNVLSISGSTITVKASALAGTTKYDTIIATPPATWTPATVEVVSVNIEDANGDSSVTIQAGSVSTYEIWKITDATPPDNYATGTLLATVGPGKYRFIHADGYKMVIRDQTSSYRVVTEMEKGVYTAELFFGAQVQLAQAATVEQIYTLTQTLEVDVSAIKGTGFIKDKHSLTNIKKKAALAAALSA